MEQAGPWNESLSLIDDFEYMIRLISQSGVVLFCDEAVLMYRSGNLDTLSGQTSPKHMVSAFNSLELGIQTILSVKNDSRSRQACANTYKRWSYLFYPDHEDLLDRLETKIEELGGSDIGIMGGPWFLRLSGLVGWKRAKKIKRLLSKRD